jgi:hypothetical protein
MGCNSAFKGLSNVKTASNRMWHPSLVELKFQNKNTYLWKVKEKCTLVQALRLCTARTAHIGSRGIALLFHNHGTRRGWRASVTLRSFFTPGKEPVPIVQKAGWGPGPVYTCATISPPPGFDPRTVQPVGSRYTDCAIRTTPTSEESTNSHCQIILF